jgi:hypothetical protein
MTEKNETLEERSARLTQEVIDEVIAEEEAEATKKVLDQDIHDAAFVPVPGGIGVHVKPTPSELRVLYNVGAQMEPGFQVKGNADTVINACRTHGWLTPENELTEAGIDAADLRIKEVPLPPRLADLVRPNLVSKPAASEVIRAAEVTTMKFQAGQTVTWGSQAGGSLTKKTGKIIGICLKGQDAHKILESAGVVVNCTGRVSKDSPRTKVTGINKSHVADRYVIEVKPSPKHKVVYYIPLVSVVDGNGKLVKVVDPPVEAAPAVVAAEGP